MQTSKQIQIKQTKQTNKLVNFHSEKQQQQQQQQQQQ